MITSRPSNPPCQARIIFEERLRDRRLTIITTSILLEIASPVASVEMRRYLHISRAFGFSSEKTMSILTSSNLLMTYVPGRFVEHEESNNKALDILKWAIGRYCLHEIIHSCAEKGYKDLLVSQSAPTYGDAHGCGRFG